MTSGDGALVVEVATAEAWSSLTFTGERHRLVVRLPPGTPMAAIDGPDFPFSGAIVAVEHAGWASDSDGRRLTLALLVIHHPPFGDGDTATA